MNTLPPLPFDPIAQSEADAAAEEFLRDLEDDDGAPDGYQGENW